MLLRLMNKNTVCLQYLLILFILHCFILFHGNQEPLYFIKIMTPFRCNNKGGQIGETKCQTRLKISDLSNLVSADPETTTFDGVMNIFRKTKERSSLFQIMRLINLD